MKRTPSTLRWFIEQRARLAGELLRLDELAKRIAEERAARAGELASIEHGMRIFDASADPSTIPAVRSWEGRYGKRGNLKESLQHVLEAAYPDPVTTTDAALQVCSMLKLDFETLSEYRRWVDNSVLKQLKRFASEGVADRLHDPEARGEVGRWRWVVSEKPSLAQLREAAAASGVELAANDSDQGE